MKIKDLATAKGIDHDYNYLTSIEREFDRAEKEARSRGIVLEDAAVGHSDTRDWKSRGLNGPVKGEVAMKAALEQCKVIIARAPKGMARNKQNQTSWHKKCVPVLSISHILICYQAPPTHVDYRMGSPRRTQRVEKLSRDTTFT